MELVDYLRMLRRQWVWVVGCVVVLTALAAVYVMTAPKTYKATADVYVGSSVIGTSAPDNAAAQSASNYVFDRIDTYATFVDYPQVLQPVIDGLKLPTTANDLAKQVSSAVVPSTVIISVSATDTSPTVAQNTANAVAKQLTVFIPQVDVPVAGGASPVKPEVKNAATLPGAPDSPNRNLMIALGVLVGLALGLVIASLRDQMRRTRPAKGSAAPAAAATPTEPDPSAFRPQPTKPDEPVRPAPSSEGVVARDGDDPSTAVKPMPSASLEAALASTQARTRGSATSSEPISVPPADGSSSR
jgi:capsular polysaccharide biosynthesis protein